MQEGDCSYIGAEKSWIYHIVHLLDFYDMHATFLCWIIFWIQQ